jgi:2-amino-4-hydroxy-6-hydroxymethyldihydropteridine diphosphokinase
VTRVAIALGSNLGDREATLRAAVAALAPFVDHLRISSFHETDPVGMPGSPAPFLNAAVVGETSLTAEG